MAATGSEFDEQVLFIQQTLQYLLDRMEVSHQEALASIDTMTVAMETGAEQIPGYNADVSQVSVTYQQPTIPTVTPDYDYTEPTSPTALSRGLSIPDEEWEAIWAKSSDQISRSAAGALQSASMSAALAGHALPSETELGVQAEILREKQSQQGEASRSVAVEHAKASREDTLAISQQEITLFQAQWAGVAQQVAAESARIASLFEQSKVEIASEAERRGWSTVQLRSILEPALQATQMAIQQMQLSLQLSVDASKASAEFNAGMTQALLAAADVGATTRAGLSLSGAA